MYPFAEKGFTSNTSALRKTRDLQHCSIRLLSVSFLYFRTGPHRTLRHFIHSTAELVVVSSNDRGVISPSDEYEQGGVQISDK